MSSKNKLNLSIGFVGMSHLGQNTSIAASEKVNNVVCFDQNPKVISNLNNYVTDVDEPDLSRFLRSSKNINFTSDLRDLTTCDIVYLSKDVPTDENGISNMKIISELINNICDILSKDVIFVILCQVPPSFTRTFAQHFKNLYYQVETLIFGNAIERARFPERIILGCKNNKHFIDNKLNIYLKSFNCPIMPMVYESAELAKTAINIVLASQVSVANTLSEICENSDGDWYEVIPALNLDKRIGKFAYLKPGLGLSGGNIERDIRTLISLSDKYNCNNLFLESLRKLSKYRKNWPIDIFNKNTKPGEINSVGIIGLAYKLNTNSIKNSPSIELIQQLNIKKIKVYDQLVKHNNFIKKEITFCKSMLEVVKNVDALFIMLPYQELKHISLDSIYNSMNGNLIIDPFRTLPINEDEKLRYFVLGKN